MKRNLLICFTLILSTNLFSQSFDVSKIRAGGGLMFATEIKNVGLTLNGTYEITEQWEGSLAFTHIFEKDYVKWNVLDLDGHYVFYKQDEKLNVYGLAGLSFTFWKVTIPTKDLGYGFTTPEITETGSDIGLNIGVGATYKITDNLNLSPEMRFTIIDGSYLRIGATLQYMF